MELTPNEMKNHQFSNQMRGFDKEEVKAFIEGAANALEIAYGKVEQLNRDNESLRTRYEELKRLEDTIKHAVLEAQKNADQIIANSKKEGELTVQEAKAKADKLRDDKERQLHDLEQRIQKLEYTKEQFYSKLRSEIEAHLKLVDSIVPPEQGMKSEELTTSEEPAEEKPAQVEKERPSLDMKDDDIDAALENLSGTVSSEPESSPEQGAAEGQSENQPQEMAEVAEGEKSSEEKEEVQDGQSKGYDF